MSLEIIQKFHQKYLSHTHLHVIDEDNDLINCYIEKVNDKYTLFINYNTLKKMNLNNQEIEALLYHELGHYKLGHFNINHNIELHFMILILSCVVLSFLLIMNIFLNISIISLLVSFFVIYLSLDFLKTLKIVRYKEYEADMYAMLHTNKSIMSSLLVKMESLYPKESLLKEVLSTHPQITKRIQRILFI